MSFRDISESGLLYTAVIVAILLVAVGILYYFKICYSHAVACGVPRETLKAVIKSSVSFSILPSIAVVAGLITLVTVIGLPYAWLRLSVLGSVSYELMASNMALNVLGLDVASADGHAFGLVMWAMCTGITLPLILNVVMCKPIHMGTLQVGKKDLKWGQVSQTTFMTALLLALIVPMFGKGIVDFLTFLTSALIGAAILHFSQKSKYGWLASFTLAFSLIGAMGASVIFDRLLH